MGPTALVTMLFSMFTVLLFSAAGSAAANKEIRWLTFGQIPAYISTGAFKNQGFMDKTIRFIHKTSLTDVDPAFFQVNHNRFNMMAVEKGNCYIGWKTFENHRIFSTPIFIWYPSGIITHKRNQAAFGPEGSILSLKKIMGNKALTLGVIDAFAYSPEIQKLLAAHRGAGHVYFMKSSTMQVNLKMLTGRRIHYTIGWPSQPIVEERLNRLKNDFIYYNVEEDQNYLYVGVSCSDCDRGRRIIERVNALFSDREALLKVMDFVKEWVVMSEQHESLYRETILLGKDHPKVIHMSYP